MSIFNQKVAILPLIFIVVIVAIVLIINLQNQHQQNTEQNSGSTSHLENNYNQEENAQMNKLYINVNGRRLEVALENNASTRALIERLEAGDIIVEAEDYGGFEKVGKLGFSLPADDRQMTTAPGDLILYQSNQLTLHYGTNTWSYTKLGHINISEHELKDILGEGSVQIILSAD